MSQNPPETVIEVASHALFAVGDEVRFDSGEVIGQLGKVTTIQRRECPIDRKKAWYYRVKWQGARTDQGLYHETLLCAANAALSRPEPLKGANDD